MKILGVIPARYQSSRFPGKPLAMIGGKSMIQRVYHQVQQSAAVDYVVVATDDARIFDHVRQFGGQVVMTCKSLENGTERSAEAAEILEYRDPPLIFDVVINIQGDEPFIEPAQIDRLASLFRDESVEIGTLISPIKSGDDLFDPGVVKAVPAINGNVLYFSRQPIPYLRDVPNEKWTGKHVFYRHIGIYGYRRAVLKKLVELPAGKYERAEKLEQLRWLENGYAIRAEITEFESISIDTPEDLSKINNNR